MSMRLRSVGMPIPFRSVCEGMDQRTVELQPVQSACRYLLYKG